MNGHPTARSARYDTPVPLPGVDGTNRLAWLHRASVPITEAAHLRRSEGHSAQGGLLRETPRISVLRWIIGGTVKWRPAHGAALSGAQLGKAQARRSGQGDRRLAWGAEAPDAPELRALLEVRPPN